MVPQVLNRSAASVQELKRLLEAFTHCRLEKVLQEDLAELPERHFYCRGNESRQAIATAEATQTWSASDLAALLHLLQKSSVPITAEIGSSGQAVRVCQVRGDRPNPVP